MTLPKERSLDQLDRDTNSHAQDLRALLLALKAVNDQEDIKSEIDVARDTLIRKALEMSKELMNMVDQVTTRMGWEIDAAKKMN